MSIQSEIDRLNSIKERIRVNLVAQGIAVPEDAVLADMAEQILSVAGEPGVSATHSWEGTVLTITSASGTSSADLKGEKGEPANQDMFYAVYGVTTCAEMNEAYAAGMKIFCIVEEDEAYCPLYKRYNDSLYCFYRGGYYIYNSANNWFESVAYESTSNKTTAVTTESTDDQYPTAKAVYDLFNSIVNADEVSY